jgi:hypothetical protein
MQAICWPAEASAAWSQLVSCIYSVQKTEVNLLQRYLRLPQRLKYIILSSGLLRCVRWFKTDVSVPSSTLFLNGLNLQDGTES